MFITILFPDKVCGIITDQFELLEKAIHVVVFALAVQIFNIPCQVYKYALQAIEMEKWVLKLSVIMSAFCCITIFLAVYIFKLELVGVFLGFGSFYFIFDIMYWGKYRFVLKNNKDT